MRIFFAEADPDYSSYTFPYGIYAIPESADELDEVYNRGFLPYTGNVQLNHAVFYKARSLKVDLAKFKDTSENRRLSRKYEGRSVSVQKRDLSFLQSEGVVDFMLEYAGERFSKGKMPPTRLRYIFEWPFLSGILEFQLDGEILGYLLYCEFDKGFHYWFSFYNLKLPPALAPGKYMMWKTIHHLRALDLEYLYLGTCYGSTSLYKVRDFKGMDFHDGNQWISDLKLLKKRCRTDDEMVKNNGDSFKSAEDMNRYIRDLGIG
ncbi:MAG: GNAT family N-acetyltransferase [Saprospirales bacterium]|nr:MAG: GNAT family N-acetyltransferase [Saprospirales bacterium]